MQRQFTHELYAPISFVSLSFRSFVVSAVPSDEIVVANDALTTPPSQLWEAIKGRRQAQVRTYERWRKCVCVFACRDACSHVWLWSCGVLLVCCDLRLLPAPCAVMCQACGLGSSGWVFDGQDSDRVATTVPLDVTSSNLQLSFTFTFGAGGCDPPEDSSRNENVYVDSADTS